MSRQRPASRHRAAPAGRRRPARPRRRGRPRTHHRSVLAAAVLTVLAVAGGMTGGGAQEAVGAAEAVSASDPAPRPARVAQQALVSAPRPAAREVGPERPDTSLPRRSGAGRRIVFSEGRQRVWLVGADDEVRRTYPVSGSLYDNLDPGHYEVYSRSEHARGIDDSGTMQYFVRFTRGENAAIGFHDIPEHEGRPLQTRAELGTPQSHGCIRQRRADAIALWRFAPLGTKVVVTR